MISLKNYFVEEIVIKIPLFKLYFFMNTVSKKKKKEAVYFYGYSKEKLFL